MASLLTDPLFEISGNGPPPIKDFFYFSVTKSDVIWRWWKISLRTVDRLSKPGKQMESHQDFLGDTWLQSEVSMVFGRQILEYTKNLCQGHYDYLERLSDSLLLRITSYLELEDVGQLGRTSHKFRKLCGSEELWEQLVQRHCNTVSDEVKSLALEMGWRSIFFTSKLQLQKLISRRRLKMEGKELIPYPDVKAVEPLNESSDSDQASGFEEESLPGIVTKLTLGGVTDAGSVSSSCCDVYPAPNPEPEVDSLEALETGDCCAFIILK